MVVCDTFIFVELPRTGSTHTKRLLVRCLGGRRSGMHEPVPAEMITGNRYFLGTVRNPWNWYVSMWSIGCGRAGRLHHRATRDAHSVTKGPWAGERFDPSRWRAVYADRSARDIEAFREWLRLVHSPREMALALPEWYGRSGMRLHSGFYSFYYASLFCREQRRLLDSATCTTLGELNDFVDRNFYLTHVARTERLGWELVDALRDMQVQLDSVQAEAIQTASPSNQSHREGELEDYYDDESFALVRARERLVIERHNYEFRD